MQSSRLPGRPTFVGDGRPKTKTSGRFMLEEGISVELVWMTPELARWMLDNLNTGNVRKLKPSQIRKLRAEFQRVGFALTGESIIFGVDGRLLDGQHRLTALAQTGVSGWALLVYGVKEGARWNIDTAQGGRSVADIIGGYDVKSEKSVAALARLCFLHANTENPTFAHVIGRGSDAQKTMEKFGNKAFAEWIVARADLLLQMHNAGQACSSRAILGGSNSIVFAPTISALASIGTPHAKDALQASLEYVSGLGEVSGLARGDARAALLRYRGFKVIGKGNVANYREHLIAVCTSAWNAWIERHPLERVQAPRSWDAKVVTYADKFLT